MSVRAVLVSLRPHQWTKNLVVLAALAFLQAPLRAAAAVAALLAFALFCGLSGTVYLLNDVADVERDRLHPTKRLRPIASGALSVRTAVGAGGRAGRLCVGLSFLLGPTFAPAPPSTSG
jgi:4-hydroxybenzoate polyprenyltransferase